LRSMRSIGFEVLAMTCRRSQRVESGVIFPSEPPDVEDARTRPARDVWSGRHDGQVPWSGSSGRKGG
jgi:hypothetical protein